MIGLKRTFEDIFEEAVRKRTGEIIEEECARAVNAIRARLRSETAKLALSLIEEYDIEQRGTRLIITVKNLPNQPS